MKRCLCTFLFVCCGSLAWTQTTAPAPAASAAPAVKPDPEGVAAKDPNKVVATINGQNITAKQAADLLKLVPEEQRKNLSDLRSVIQQLYLATDLAKKAEAEKLDQESPYKERVEYAKMSTLANAYVAELQKKDAAPVDAHQYYDSHPQDFDIAHVSGIAIEFTPPGTPASKAEASARTEEQAQQKAEDIEKRLKSGADFAAEARANSDDPQSAARGGDLGAIPASVPNLPPQLHEAIFDKLQPGQISDPIKVNNVLYIIKVTSRSKVPFDQAKASIDQQLKAQHDRQVVQGVLDKYKINVVDPSFFGGSSATPSASSTIPSLSRPSGVTASNGAPAANASPQK